MEDHRIEQATEALKLAYRKHHLGDEAVGWNELGDKLLNALCELMTDKGFQEWMKGYVQDDEPERDTSDTGPLCTRIRERARSTASRK